VADLFETVLSQRACRSFRADEVPDEAVERALEAATHAPSAENRQPWVFVVVREAPTREAIGRLMLQAWEGGGRAFSERRLTPRLLTEVDEGVRGSLAAAPVMVVVCGDHERGLPETLASSVYPAVQNLLLAAGALGLGSAMTTIATTSPAELAALLSLPDHVVPMAVVPLGWPARALGPPRREPVTSRAHRERYGARW
jgi:nitroreductase